MVDRDADRDATRDAARAAKERLHAELVGLPGFGGIGIGRRHGAWVVTVRVEVEGACDAVPGSYGGVPVEVRVTGSVQALTTPADDPPGVDHPAPRHLPVALPRGEVVPPAQGPGAGSGR